MTADLSLFALNFNLVDMMQVPLCDETMVADENNENECPGDGANEYSFTYNLPNAGSEQTSWLASGWEGSGVIQMFAEQNENMKIGECYLDLKTYVTQKSTSGEKSLIGTPSAAATVGIVLGAVAVMALACLFCYCCRRKRKEKAKISAEDNESHFKRMEDEKSFWSGTKSAKSSGTKSTKKGSVGSVVSELP